MMEAIFGIIALLSFVWPWIMVIIAATVLTRILSDIGSFLGGGQSERVKQLEKDLELARQQQVPVQTYRPRPVTPFAENSWVEYAKTHPSVTLNMVEKKSEDGEFEVHMKMVGTIPFSERPQARFFLSAPHRKRIS